MTSIPQEQLDPSSDLVQVVPEFVPADPTRDAIKQARMSQWKGMAEQELQQLIQQASTLRKQIDTSKTNTKKEYYQKKFKKVSDQVMRYVATLQAMDHESTPAMPRATGTSP